MRDFSLEKADLLQNRTKSRLADKWIACATAFAAAIGLVKTIETRLQPQSNAAAPDSAIALLGQTRPCCFWIETGRARLSKQWHVVLEYEKRASRAHRVGSGGYGGW